MLQKALHTSAEMHKRALHFESACKHRDEMIAQQEAAINERHHAINSLQSALAQQTHRVADQNKALAERVRTIAALEAQITKLVSHQQEQDSKPGPNPTQMKVGHFVGWTSSTSFPTLHNSK